MDAPLSATLQFSTPLANSISSWPEQQADITRKVRKLQKSLPPFGWDTEPVMGAEMIMEESFIDVFCDLVYGGGWIDIGREESDRECNWALVSASVERIRDRRSDVFLRRSSSSRSRCQGQLFLAVQTRALPPPYSFSRNLCRSNTASSCPRVFRTKERCRLSSHLASQSNGSKPRPSMDALMLSGMCQEALITAKPSSRVSFRAIIARRRSSHWVETDP